MGLKKQGINRDISWLAFNGRVLQEAADEENHIYDRLRFLGIFSNNLDEFFRVRVATLNRMTRTAGNKLKMHLEETLNSQNKNPFHLKNITNKSSSLL